MRTTGLGSVLVCVAGLAPAWGLDAFDKQRTPELLKALDAKPLTEVTAELAEDWKPLEPALEAPCLVVRTNDGNTSKLLVTWGFRKQGEKTIPVAVLERYVTYTQNRGDNAQATGKNVMLFPGFTFDLDLGQVVPAGFGGDLELTPTGALKTLDGVRLVPLPGAPAPQTGAKTPPREGAAPQDFNGVWKLQADGRWSGTVELKIDAQGFAEGTYQSDETQSSYPVTGKLAGQPHQLRFEIDFANSTQAFEAFLWTKDQSAMAGTTTLAGRKFGFFATRVEEKAK